MFETKYHIAKSIEKKTLKQEFADCLQQIDAQYPVIQLTVFWDCPDNETYLQDVEEMKKLIRENFPTTEPTVSFVAQKPLDVSLCIEVLQVSSSEAKIAYKKEAGLSYVVLTKDAYKELHLFGVSASLDLSVKEQATVIFEKISNILQKEQMQLDAIVRQWNYIEDITGMTGAYQRYQLFNDARTHFYEKSDWKKGYPAATGIGTQVGGVVVDCVAVSGHAQEYPLVNPLQEDAHKYTQEVLIGAEDTVYEIKTTPKFERAKYVGAEQGATVFVSGTAAIRGEDSLGLEDPILQTEITLENIVALISEENITKTLSKTAERGQLENLRVYIKKAADFDSIKQVCEAKYPTLPISYLLSDICREELLVEIEGKAHLRN